MFAINKITKYIPKILTLDLQVSDKFVHICKEILSEITEKWNYIIFFLTLTEFSWIITIYKWTVDMHIKTYVRAKMYS